MAENSIQEPDPPFDLTLRPPGFEEFYGQEKVTERLMLMVEAARQREDVLEHILLSGPPGLGKTTLANIIADAAHATIHTTSGPQVEKAGDLAGILTNVQRGDVLFIDEIHRFNKSQQDALLPYVESGQFKLIGATTEKQKTLPGSSKPQDFGAAPAYQTSNLPKEQSINSVESAQTVIAEDPETRESLLPDKPAEVQYEFAVSFMKIGDYETAEFALKEFIDKNKDHDLAGSAQYWYCLLYTSDAADE